MLVAAIALSCFQSGLLAKLDDLAQKRDVQGLSALAAPGAWKGRNPLDAIRTNGAYDTGRFGWHAIEGNSPDGKGYVVLTTPLTSEDIGERLFETDGTALTKYVDEREDNGWRIEKHSLTVRFDIPNKSVRIVDLINVKHQGSEGPLVVRLSPNYRVQSIKGSSGAVAKWSQLGGIVFLGAAKDGDSFTIEYTGVVDRPAYAGSITPSEAMLTNDYWYPMIGRKPSPFTLKVFGPANWTAVSHGELISSEVAGDQRQTIYEMKLPISYWSLNIGPYKTVEESIGGRKYRVWSKTLSDAQMKLQPKFYPQILDTYQTFAKFPFSGYGACVTPLYGGGALEGYSFETAGYYPAEDAHETAHTWFGGMVNNTYLTSMWNESFAVWADGYYHRNTALGSIAERRLAFVSTPQIDDVAYFAAPLRDSPPDIGPAASTLGYGKGAFVLQMLEQEIGTEGMVAACRDWLAHQDKTRGAEWEDFEAAVKRTSTKDMTWFFDQWVRRPGYARFTISDLKYQAGSITGSVKFQGEPYRLHCEVLIQSASGENFSTVELNGSGAFSIPSKEKPHLVSFDPWNRVVRKVDGSELPVTLARTLGGLHRANALGSENMLLGIGKKPEPMPAGSLDGWFIVGSPELDIRLRPLFSKAGFEVHGTKLTYRGTTIDLTKGAALGIVDLAGGGKCAIGIGSVLHSPGYGNARLVLVDELGRFLRGVTEPKTKGNLTFKM
jgi:hypothetical protein